MRKKEGEEFFDLTIGIVGFGHLGQAIAQSFIRHEFHRLLISYKGSAATAQRVSDSGLTSCVADNQQLFKEADIVFLAIKPQDVRALKEAAHASKALLVSCVAGCPLQVLQEAFPCAVYRMMVSGPDTIHADCGIASIFPQHQRLESIAKAIKLNTFPAFVEGDINVFTAGVCLPAALLKETNPGRIAEAKTEMAKDYPIFPALFKWAQEVMPSFQANEQKQAYIKKMVTKGGITEAIVKSLEAGELLAAALKKGIARSEEISYEIRKSIRMSAE